MRFFLSTGAFAVKEIRQLLRQPRLIAVLVVGPFLILGLFAFGFQPAAPAFDVAIAVEGNDELAVSADDLAEAFGESANLVAEGIREEEGTQMLRDGEVDMVVVLPADPMETIRSGDQATIRIIHDELDPFDSTFIGVAAQTAVDELNRSIQQDAIASAQDRSGPVDESLAVARQAVSDLRTALEAGSGVEQARDDALAALSDLDERSAIQSDLIGRITPDRLRADVSPAQIENVAADDQDSLASVAQLEEDIVALEAALGDVRAIPPEVLARPFMASAGTLLDEDIPITSFYTPAVAVVLLQHLVLTFAALSIARERESGATVLFRVGPVGPAELLLGKLIGYLVVGSVVTALVVPGAIFLLGTPMTGSWLWLTVVLALLLLASLALGFVVAAASKSASQAIQFAMLALLFTIFFSGLVVSLSRLVDGVRQLAFLAPATSAIAAMQDVMFRGRAPEPVWLMILVVHFAITMTIALVWLRRRQLA